MTTHTNDCSSCDFRIVKVPAQTHAPGALHHVVLASFFYPRYGTNHFCVIFEPIYDILHAILNHPC